MQSDATSKMLFSEILQPFRFFHACDGVSRTGGTVFRGLTEQWPC